MIFIISRLYFICCYGWTKEGEFDIHNFESVGDGLPGFLFFPVPKFLNLAYIKRNRENDSYSFSFSAYSMHMERQLGELPLFVCYKNKKKPQIIQQGNGLNMHTDRQLDEINAHICPFLLSSLIHVKILIPLLPHTYKVPVLCVNWITTKG
jgi:hypothetical protein